MAYDFSGLTRAQENLLTVKGWSATSCFPKPQRRTVQPLIDRGLVIDLFPRSRGDKVLAYGVPFAVHIAWCEYCEAQGVA